MNDSPQQPVVPFDLDLPLPLYERLMAMCATDASPDSPGGKNPIAMIIAYVREGLTRDDLPAPMPASAPGFAASVPPDYRPSTPYAEDTETDSDDPTVAPDPVVAPTTEPVSVEPTPQVVPSPVVAPSEQAKPQGRGAPVRGRDGRIYDDLDL